ncbi:exported hypothetical protein [Mesorhizobium prunaredense]|uniref:Outer membrane protein beta-barrel domain-containing protein n=2 Tax=Mesorhizobium prunaredense TaxID=1631249 RepID=A0A1R3VHL2_9HYPH|nr:exported hypothetical protein [Mesorhizobium prunaredense]
MRGLQVALAAVILSISLSSGLADDNSPFIYFATQDPFADGLPTKNDVYVFGGVFARGAFGDAINVLGADYTDNYIIGAAYGRDFVDIGAGFVLGGVTGAAVRFGEDDDTTGELWAGARLPLQALPRSSSIAKSSTMAMHHSSASLARSLLSERGKPPMSNLSTSSTIDPAPMVQLAI